MGGTELWAVLDAVEAGETIVLTRDGSPVARLAPERTRGWLDDQKRELPD